MVRCFELVIREVLSLYSLVAPVQSRCDVLLHVLHTVMGEVAHQHLPPQVQDFIHHVPKPVEQIALILLREGRKNGKGGTKEEKESQSDAVNEREIDKEEGTDKNVRIYNCTEPPQT